MLALKLSIIYVIACHPAPSVAPGNFRTTNITSSSMMFQWDRVVDEANGVIRWYVITCDVDDEGNNLMVSINATFILYIVSVTVILY